MNKVEKLEQEIFILEMKDTFNFDDRQRLYELKQQLQEAKNEARTIF